MSLCHARAANPAGAGALSTAHPACTTHMRYVMARAARTCNTCSAVVPARTSRCDACVRKADAARGTPRERGYATPGHRAFRDAVLSRDPVCVLCRSAWSNVADHHPHSRRDLVAMGVDANDAARGRGLCTPCHNAHTARSQPGGWHS